MSIRQPPNYLPTEFTEHRNDRWGISSHRLHRFSQIRRVWHPCHTHAATKLSSHRIRGTHRNFWRNIFSHRLHGCAQIRRVWHPCHTHAATKLSSHRTLRSLTICVHLCASVGGYSPPETSVYSVNSVGGLAQTNLEWVLWKEFGGRRGYGSHKTIFPQNSRNTQKRLAEKKNLCTSVKSVGGYSPPEASVYSVNSVGGLAQTNLEWVLWKEFGGLRGYGRDAIPSYENSHRLHRCAQIRRVWHPAIPTQPPNYLPTEFAEHT